MADNSFADMLLPGELVLAQIVGEGRTVERGHGLERTWWQVGLTRDRLLVIRMKQAGGADRWDVIARLAGPRANVQIASFPRTTTDTARLTISGAGDPIVFVDVDQPPLLQQVKPFLAAWGGPVAGGPLAVVEDDGYGQDTSGMKPFLYAAGALLVFFLICCGCLGLGGVFRAVYYSLLSS